MDQSPNFNNLGLLLTHLFPVFLLHRSSVEANLRYPITSINTLVGSSNILKHKYFKNTPLLNLIKFENNFLASNMSVSRFPRLFSTLICWNQEPDTIHTVHLIDVSLLIYTFPLSSFSPLVIYLLKKLGHLFCRLSQFNFSDWILMMSFTIFLSPVFSVNPNTSILKSDRLKFFFGGRGGKNTS